MSVRAMDVVWRHYPAGGGELTLALALADWADDDGGGIYPSIAAAAAKSRLSERQVQRLLRVMVRRGYLEVTGVTATGTRIYRLRLDRLQGLAVVYGSRQKGGDKMSPGDIHVTPGGDTNVTPGVTSMSPKPPIEPSDISVTLGAGAEQQVERELRECAPGTREVILRALAERQKRTDLAPVRHPHLWVRAMVRRLGRGGTHAPAGEHALAETRYRQMREAAEAAIDARRERLLAQRRREGVEAG